MINSQLHYITFMVQRPVAIISTLITIEIHFFFPPKFIHVSTLVETKSNENPEKSIRWLNCIEMYRIQRKETKKNQIIRRRPPHLLPNFCIIKHEIKKRSRTQLCDANEERVFWKIRGINDPFGRRCRSIKKGIIDPIGKLRKSHAISRRSAKVRGPGAHASIFERKLKRVN